MEYSIEPGKKGLFVIIKQLEHKVVYHPTHEEPKDWGEVRELHYTEDEKAILNAFKLRKGHENVFANENLTNSAEGKSFDRFMEAVCAYNTKEPQFVMVFLMSHGFENGDFLLASSGEKVGDKMESKGPCCTERTDNKHGLEGDCYGRNFVDHVMKKVCDNFADAIPKVFVNQTCRGAADRDLVDVGASDGHKDIEASDTELLVPPTLHNVFLFRACVEGSASQVASTGSVLVEGFCKAVEEVKVADTQFQLLIAKARKETMQYSDHAMQDILGCVEKKREHCTGGWIMNVCQRATALAANKMLVEVVLPTTSLGQLLARPYDDIIKCDQQTYKDLWYALDEHQRNSKHANMVKKVMAQYGNYAWTMLYYLWCNIRCYHPKRHMTEISNEGERLELEEILDGIIEEVADVEPISKQQPHISSSLDKKLSLTKILQTQSAMCSH